jgi:hypothetical protein
VSAEKLVVKPWKRFGKDRLYVSNADGRTLGFLDRATGDVHVAAPGDQAPVEAALAQHRPAVAMPVQPAPSQPVIDETPYAVVVPVLARDLAANKAGTGAAQMAAAKRAEAPVRTTLARVLGVHTAERAWRVGAQGEQIVGKQLDRLEKLGWTIVHDVPVGENGANIDHVIVGPGGVFTVNSKYHWGGRVWVGGSTMMVNGTRVDYLRKARWEAQRAAKLLSAAYGEAVAVTALLSVVCENRTVKSQPVDGAVRVMGPRETRKYVEALPARYQVHEVDRLALCARRSTTWRP